MEMCAVAERVDRMPHISFYDDLPVQSMHPTSRLQMNDLPHSRPSQPEAEIDAPTRPRTIAEEIEALTDPSFMTSLARGLAVLRAFSDQRRSLTIAQISHKTGI